jgi:hypothetical protein
MAFSNFSTLCPSVRNLSLANNAIESSEELEAFSGLQLRELRLAGNPVLGTEGAGGYIHVYIYIHTHT